MAVSDKKKAEVEARSLALARMSAGICDEKRAEDIRILDVRKICEFADFFVIASTNGGPQMRGVSKDIERKMADEKCRMLSKCGVSEGRWAILDYGDVVVHLFDNETREFYQLEHLWGDAKKVNFATK